jgi:molybdopterin-biosynthesis enzyme MoeA-like protein
VKAAIILLNNVSKPDSARWWLEGYLKAIGVEVATYSLNFENLDSLGGIFEKNDAIIVVGAAGDKRAASKIAEILKLGVEVNQEALELIRNYYSDKMEIPKDLEDKAVMPEFSYVIQNERGAVPGFVAFSLTDDKFIAATPPRFEEAVECFELGIQDFFRQKTGKKYSVTFALYLDGSIEAAEKIVERLHQKEKNVFMRLDARFLGTRGVPIAFTVFAESPEELSDTMSRLEEESSKLASELGLRIFEKEKDEEEM